MFEDALDGTRLGDKDDDPQRRSTQRTPQPEDLVDVGEARPSPVGRTLRVLQPVAIGDLSP
jgi:hypothetical protein